MISSRFSTACGFSILAMTGTRRPSSAMITWTRWTSFALRTNDRATMSQPCLESPSQVGLILLGEGRNVHGHARQVDALVVRDRTGHDHLGDDDGSVDLDDLDAHLAVVDQEEVAGRDVGGQTLERRRDDLFRAEDVLGRDLEDVALSEVVRAVLELAEADLGPLQIDRARRPRGRRRPLPCGHLRSCSRGPSSRRD